MGCDGAFFSVGLAKIGGALWEGKRLSRAKSSDLPYLILKPVMYLPKLPDDYWL